MNIKQKSGYYRGDIDGLRAIAVILVIFFHAGSDFISSGFIGVDIFFVISGYLITGIILTQIREASFSLANFFNRRLWRIQPALIAVSLVVVLVASFLYVVPDYIGFLKSAKYNSLFLSNQFFAKQSITYASPQSEFFPLLHTWSLSIEWQWYLFLPFIVLMGALISKRAGWISDRQEKNDFISILIWGGVTVVLSIISLLISQKSPGESYYFLTARAFEFTAGGTTFLLNRQVNAIGSWLFSPLSTVSLIVLLLIALQKGIIAVYPDLWTIAVVICSAMVLFTGHYKETFLAKFLGLTPLSFTGRLSYSLYLWHWPVFAFCRYYGISLAGMNLVFVAFIILGLSLGSYFLIEERFRRVRIKLKWSFSVLVLLPILFFTSLYSIILKHNGFPERLGASYAKQLDTLDAYSALASSRPDCLSGFDDPNKCLLGDSLGSRTALMIGDSFSNQYWGFFDVLAKAAHVKMSALSESSCLALPDIWQFDWWVYHNVVYQECHDRTEKYYQLVKQNHYDFVIIGQIWEMYAIGPHLINKNGDERSDSLSKERMNRAVRKALNVIIATGARPVFIKTILAMPEGYQECISRQAIRRGDFQKAECNALRPKGDEDSYATSLFTKLQSEYPTLIIIDPRDIQCQKGECISQLASIPLYRDVGHLTDYVSYSFGQMYLDKFGNPFNL